MEKYKTAIEKFGVKGGEVEVKICEIVRVDARNNRSRITLSDGSFIKDHRCVADVAMRLPYNHFGYYRQGCIFCMHRIKSSDSNTMEVLLDNGTKVKIGTRTIFKRFEDDFYSLKR